MFKRRTFKAERDQIKRKIVCLFYKEKRNCTCIHFGLFFIKKNVIVHASILDWHGLYSTSEGDFTIIDKIVFAPLPLLLLLFISYQCATV